jgi:simple sugar transport system permease protein
MNEASSAPGSARSPRREEDLAIERGEEERAPPRWLRTRALPVGLSAALFVLLSAAFFLLIGRNPYDMVALIVQSSLGDSYAVTESLVRTTPILLCALATAVPARLGLITVGAEGQLYFGALLGTGFVLSFLDASAATLTPGMLAFAALGGALWALIPALLKAGLELNETITTLLINYVAALLVTWAVYGPWKNPASQGWPATADFPDASRLPTYFASRVHLGLWLGIAAAVALHVVLTRTRWGLALDVLRSNPRAAIAAGLDFKRNVLLVMALGGALAGLAGIAETSTIQGRLQANFSSGAGFSGFLVAWLARNHCLRIIPLAFLVGALLAAGDGIQMLANVPSSVTLVAQGLLFVAVLLVTGLLDRRRN